MNAIFGGMDEVASLQGADRMLDERRKTEVLFNLNTDSDEALECVWRVPSAELRGKNNASPPPSEPVFREYREYLKDCALAPAQRKFEVCQREAKRLSA